MKTKNRLFIFCVLNLLILSCNSSKEGSWNNNEIGNFVFSFPKGSKIFYNSLDSSGGEIEFKSKFIVNFSIGYFNPLVLNQQKDVILKKDTVDNFIIRTVINSNVNKFTILFYAWDTTSLTTQILDEKRYMGIAMSAFSLNKDQKNVLLKVLKTFNPDN